MMFVRLSDVMADQESKGGGGRDGKPNFRAKFLRGCLCRYDIKTGQSHSDPSFTFRRCYLSLLLYV